MKQTISVLVENQAGVLNRITSLFSRRAFNIDSLAVGVTDDPSVSRITIIVDNGNSVVEQVEKQLNKLVEVIKVRTLDETSMIGRELMILKVSANSRTRGDIMTICNICGAKVADLSPTSISIELSDTPDRVNTFEELMQLSDPYVKKLLGELDLLVDGRFLMEEKNIDLRFRGSANQRVLDVPKSLEAGAPVWAEQYR